MEQRPHQRLEGGRSVLKRIQRTVRQKEELDANEILKVEMLELPGYHSPWDNVKPMPANGVIPDGYGHEKFTYAFDPENPMIAYIRPLPSVTAFTSTPNALFLAEDNHSKKAPADAKPVHKSAKGPLDDVVQFLSGAANHLCPCCLSYYCTKKPHHSTAWTFEIYPVSAPKPAERPCGSECYLLPGPCRTYSLDINESEATTLHKILKAFLTEGPLCELRKCERPMCDGNCDRATCCQLAEIIDRPCRVVYWVILEMLASTPKDCQPVRPKIPAGLLPSARLPHYKNYKTGKRPQYKACHHPLYRCTDAKANCRCYKKATGCYASCCCSLDCGLRDMCECVDVCPGTKPQCRCAEYDCMCVKCNVAADFGHKKRTKCGHSAVQGMGTFIMEDVPAHAFIDEYTGEILTYKQCDDLSKHPDYAFYAFSHNEEFVVEGWRYGNKMRFLNHSEHNQNVLVRMIRVNGEHKTGMFAKRDLKAGEELFISYVGESDRNNERDKESRARLMQTIAQFVDVPLAPEELVPQASGLIHAQPLPKERVVYGMDVTKVTGVFCSDDVLSPEEKEQLIRHLNNGPSM